MHLIVGTQNMWKSWQIEMRNRQLDRIYSTFQFDLTITEHSTQWCRIYILLKFLSKLHTQNILWDKNNRIKKKAILSKYEQVEIIGSMSSDHNGIKL